MASQELEHSLSEKYRSVMTVEMELLEIWKSFAMATHSICTFTHQET